MNDRALIEAALAAREHAYVPYSGYAVGAALLTDSGRLYTGCNIENAAFSPTNCAERTAIFKAVSEGARRLSAIAIAAGRVGQEAPLAAYAAPCGVCRQVMAEFAGEGFRVLLAKSPDDFCVFSLEELLPLGFTQADLNKS